MNRDPIQNTIAGLFRFAEKIDTMPHAWPFLYLTLDLSLKGEVERNMIYAILSPKPVCKHKGLPKQTAS